jgi:hypothetical protein
MFPELEGQVISRFILAEKNQLIAYPEGDVELVFVELPKFHRQLEDLRGLTDEWLYFVGRAGELEQVPEGAWRLKGSARTRQAFGSGRRA